jgi:hypothetical protein
MSDLAIPNELTTELVFCDKTEVFFSSVFNLTQLNAAIVNVNQGTLPGIGMLPTYII